MLSWIREASASSQLACEDAFEAEFGIHPRELAGGDKVRGQQARKIVFAELNQLAEHAWAAFMASIAPAFTQEEKEAKLQALHASGVARKAYQSAHQSASPFTKELRLLELPDQIRLGGTGPVLPLE